MMSRSPTPTVQLSGFGSHAAEQAARRQHEPVGLGAVPVEEAQVLLDAARGRQLGHVVPRDEDAAAERGEAAERDRAEGHAGEQVLERAVVALDRPLHERPGEDELRRAGGLEDADPETELADAVALDDLVAQPAASLDVRAVGGLDRDGDAVDREGGRLRVVGILNPDPQAAEPDAVPGRVLLRLRPAGRLALAADLVAGAELQVGAALRRRDEADLVDVEAAARRAPAARCRPESTRRRSACRPSSPCRGGRGRGCRRSASGT